MTGKGVLLALLGSLQPASALQLSTSMPPFAWWTHWGERLTQP